MSAEATTSAAPAVAAANRRERSFAGDVDKLLLGAGERFHGEAILGVSKALLQAGVAYVGGYPGAPVSHLLDVFADAREQVLEPYGIHFEQSASEAGAAALLVDRDDADGFAAAMSRVLADEALAGSLITAGRDNLGRFSWDATAQGLVALYERALGSVG